MRAQVVADRGVVARSVAERLDRELAPQARGHIRLIERREHGGVVRRVYDDSDPLVVLRSRAQHRGSADVDVLDRFGVRAVRPRRRRLERIKIHREYVDHVDAVLDQHGLVDASAREQAAVDVRMQRLHAAIHDLGESGNSGDLDDGNSGRAQRLRRTARRDDLVGRCR